MMTVLRRNALKQPEEDSSGTEEGTTNDHDDRNKRSRRCSQSRPLLLVLLAALLLFAILLMWNESDKSDKEQKQQQAISSSTQHHQSKESSRTENRQSRRRDLFAQLGENCQLPPPPPRRDSWTTKPLLLPGYPSSYSEAKGPGDMIQPMIRHLTGLPQGARNFHASSKGLKRCHMTNPNVETVTCSQVHPIVSISPEKHVKLFDPNVLLAIQNFAMAFPMGYSIKANRYNNVQGQAAIDDWRKARGMYLKEAFDKWKSVITTWKTYDYYNVSMYLPYEHLMDPVQGPLLIQRLAKKLDSVGFAVVNINDDNDDDTKKNTQLLQCLWRRSIQDAAAFEEEYIQYIPAYTAKQRDYMLEQMQQLIQEMMASGDAELVGILKEYHAEIRDSIPIETEEES